MVILDVNPFDTCENQCGYDFDHLDAPQEDVMEPTTTFPEKLAFRCEKCPYQSNSRSLFSRHAVRHSMDRPYECTLCDYSVFDHCDFVGHLVFHQQSKELQCPFCSFKSYASRMKFHMLDHRGVEFFDCAECEFTTNNRKSLSRHADIFHNPLFKCEYCQSPSLKRLTKNSLIKHWDEVHAIREVTTENPDDYASDSKVTIKSEPPNDAQYGILNGLAVQAINSSNAAREFADDIEPTYHCPACEFSYPLKVLLKFHILCMHTEKISCQHCPAVMTRHTLIQHLKNMHGIRMFFDGKALRKASSISGNRSDERPPSLDPEFKSLCREPEVSLEMADDSSSFNCGGNKHEQGAVGIKPFTCSVCNFSSNSEWSLSCHMKFLHTVKYYCNHCPAIMSKYDIIKHTWDEHGVQIPQRGPSGLREAMECECDDIKSRDYYSVQFADDTKGVHLMQNGDVKPSKLFCTVCGSVAKSNYHLLKHIDMFHSKKYRCPHCSAVMTKYELINHGWNAHRVSIKAKNRFLEAVGEDNGSDDNVDDSNHNDVEFEPERTVLAQKRKSSALCSYCGYSGFPKDVDVHVDRMHRINYHCEHCSAVMPKHDLIQHYKNVHGVVISLRGHPFKKANKLPYRRGFEKPLVKVEPNSSRQVTSESRSEDLVPDAQSESGSRQKFQCPSCDHVGKSRYHIEVHVERMHKTKYCCGICSEVMPKFDLIRHNKNLHGVVTNKKGSGMTFLKATSQVSDDEIENAHSVSGPERNQCSNEPSLDTGVDLDSVNQQPAVCGFDTTATEEFPKCDHCAFSTPHRKSMLTHVVSMHRKKYSCNNCSAVMTKHELIIHSKDVHGVEIPLNGLGYVFNHVPDDSFDDFESECSVMSPNPKYNGRKTESDSVTKSNYGMVRRKCSECDFTSLYPYNLNCHFENFHQKLYHCSVCSVIMTKYEIGKHVESEHGMQLGVKSRLRLYIPDSGNASAADSATNSSTKCADDVGDDESEFVQSIRGRPRSTLKPDWEEQTDVQEGIIEVEGGEGFRCSVCGCLMKTRSSVAHHFDTLHSKKYRCNLCDTVNTKYDLIQHCEKAHCITIPNNGKGYRFQEVIEGPGESLTHVNSNEQHHPVTVGQSREDFVCSFCGLCSKYRKSVEQHVDAMHLKLYGCKECSVVMSKHDLIQHYNIVHGIVKSKKSSSSDFFQEITQVDESVGASGTDNEGMLLKEGNKWHCTICDFSCQKGNVVVHLEKMHKKKFSCVRCSVTLTKYEMIQHYEDDHNETVAPFGHTGKFFKEIEPHAVEEPACAEEVQSIPTTAQTNSGDDAECINIIQEGGEFKCSICGLSTSFKSNLKPHFECFHRKKYSCNRCSLVTTKYEMVRHYEQVHRFVIPNFGKGNIAPYCKAVADSANEVDASGFLESMVEAVMDGSVADSEEETNISTNGVSNDSFLDGHWIAGYNDQDNEVAIVKGDGGGTLKCSICGHATQLRRNLGSHIDAFHQKKYSCNRCSVVLTKYEMFQHYETVHDVQLDKSGRGIKSKYFTAVEGLGADRTVAENEGFVFQDGGEFLCAKCDYSSTHRSTVEKHLISQHVKKFSCNRCSVVMSKYDMLQHYETEHGIEIPRKGRGTTHQYFTTLHSVPSESTAGVTSSDLVDGREKAFESEVSAYKVHPTDSPSLVCKICEFSTVYDNSMELHMKNYHKRKYACNHCQAVLTKHSLIEHYSKIHGVFPSSNSRFQEVTDSSPGYGTSTSNQLSCGSSEGVTTFQCSLCDFRAKLRMHLNVHTKVMHTDKHSCTLCSEVMTKHELLDHQRNAHGASSNSTNMDHEITSASNDVSNAEAMRVRKTFTCDECTFSANSKWHLKYHMEKNHWIKYHCTHCSAVLTKHVLIQHCKNFHGVMYSTRHPFTEAKGAKIFISAKHAQGNKVKLLYNPSNPTPSVVTNSFEAQKEEGGDRAQCPQCDYSTQHKWYLAEHVESFHRKKYRCTKCLEVMTKHELFSHSKERHGIVLKRFGKLPSDFKPLSKVTESDYLMPESTQPGRSSVASSNHNYSAQVLGSTSTVNPRSQDPPQTSVEAIQSSAFQPVVNLERLQLHPDDLGSSYYAMTENEEESLHHTKTDSMLDNPKFRPR